MIRSSHSLVMLLLAAGVFAGVAAACTSGSDGSTPTPIPDTVEATPTPTPSGPSASASVQVTLTGSDTETCELTFEVGPVTNGTVGEVSDEPCVEGTPNTDSAVVTFTADPGVCGPGQGTFTYTTNDGLATSPPATVTVDIPCVAIDEGES